MNRHLTGVIGVVFTAGMLITGPALADHRPGDAGVRPFSRVFPGFRRFLR